MSNQERSPVPRYRVTANGKVVGLYSHGVEAMASLPASASGREGFEVVAELVDWGDRKHGAQEEFPQVIETRRVFP